MLRAGLLTFCIALPSMVSASDITQPSSPDILPVARGSSGVFDALKPLLDARVQAATGDFHGSYRNFGTVLLHDDKNTEALFGFAKAALNLGKGEDALKAYTKLSRLKLKDSQAINQFTGLILAKFMTDKLQEPEAQLKTALELAPHDFRLWNALGQYYDSRELWAQSQDAYKRATDTGFSKSGLHNNLGMSFLAQKKYTIAVSHFEHALRLAPKNSQFENNYRFALLMAGNYSAALKNVSDDDAGTLLGDAGYIAMQREDYPLARVLLKKAIEVSPRYNQNAAHNLKQLELRQN